jgi:hypothetical protein
VRLVGISGYPMKIFQYVLDRTELDVILSYNHYTLQNTMLADLMPYLKEKGGGIMNAAPFSPRLLTNAPLPSWHKATPEVRAVCRKAAEHCSAQAPAQHLVGRRRTGIELAAAPSAAPDAAWTAAAIASAAASAGCSSRPSCRPSSRVFPRPQGQGSATASATASAVCATPSCRRFQAVCAGHYSLSQ